MRYIQSKLHGNKNQNPISNENAMTNDKRSYIFIIATHPYHLMVAIRNALLWYVLFNVAYIPWHENKTKF